MAHSASKADPEGAPLKIDFDPRRAWHWYDFLCPFCYVGQDRTQILIQAGIEVTELPFQAHPEIPEGGVAAGPREGPMYRRLEQECRDAGLPLRWSKRLPNTRQALAAAEWVRRNRPAAFAQLHHTFFAAHFALGEDLGDPAVIDRYLAQAGVDLMSWHAARANGSALKAVSESETLGRQQGVTGTPAWFVRGQLIVGLRPRSDFRALAGDAG
jgi:predicted DsbA family dithiol-disulfide isomerase